MATLNALIRDWAARIDQRPHASGLREARLLVEHVTSMSTAAQIVVGANPLPASSAQQVDALVARRVAGEPVARLTGHASFWDFDVALNNAMLVPRDDTGTLVEAALRRLPEGKPCHVADLGTGSGIVLLALARERPELTGVGIDIAEEAVAGAQANAETLGLSGRLTFKQGNWLNGETGPFDCIVSNPPYISRSEWEGLEPEVRLHDPDRALLAGDDGLTAYRELLPQSAELLRPQGTVLVEIGATQAEAVSAIGAEAGLRHLGVSQDLAGHDRVVIFERPA
ncbi:MAG: peptide chain release factor N(5)-glutamine methyltransferase [Devosiaceae bacterium]|nr:peptide chain release factor N(5)-glutamine methyltransferase [Devosiaceae bacterium MH13]